MTPEQTRALAKVRKCLAVAADSRGDPTTRETAWRQSQAMIEKHGLQLERLEPVPPATPAGPPPLQSAEWGPYWARRTTAEASAAGLRSPVLCRDGWHVPG